MNYILVMNIAERSYRHSFQVLLVLCQGRVLLGPYEIISPIFIFFEEWSRMPLS